MRYAYFPVLVLSLLGGCSNHPLVDDVVDYSTHQIVQKLRCEAQASILEHLSNRGFVRFQKVYLDLKRDFKAYQEKKTNNNSLFLKLDKDLEAFEVEIKTSEKQRADATRIVTAIVGEIRHVEEASEKETAELDARIRKLREGGQDERRRAEIERLEVLLREVSDRKLRRLRSLQDRKAIAISKLEVLIDDFEVIKKGIEDKKKKHDVSLRVINETLESYISAKERFDAVDKAFTSGSPDSDALRKMFYSNDQASLRELFSINRTTLALKLDFKITENNNATADGTVTWPIHLGSISLGLKGGKEKARIAQRVLNITSTFEELTDEGLLGCSTGFPQVLDKRARTYPIVGDVGVGELIAQYFKVLKAATLVVATGQDTFTDLLTFTTKVSGKINPTIEIKPVHPSLVKAAFDLNADRTDLHQVILQLRPYSAPSSPSDPKLQITKIPSVTVNIAEGTDGEGSLIGVR